MIWIWNQTETLLAALFGLEFRRLSPTRRLVEDRRCPDEMIQKSPKPLEKVTEITEIRAKNRENAKTLTISVSSYPDSFSIGSNTTM